MLVHSAHHSRKVQHAHQHMCIHFERSEAVRILTPTPCLHFHLAVHLLVRCPYLGLKKIRIYLQKLYKDILASEIQLI